VSTTYLRFPGLIHGFVNMAGVSPAARDAMIEIAKALRAALGLGSRVSSDRDQ
jgi:acetyl esterase/lipase